jgi:hypothetical protein
LRASGGLAGAELVRREEALPGGVAEPGGVEE